MVTFNININNTHTYPELEAMNEALDNLRREVSESKDATASAITLIEGITDQLNDLVANATDVEALKAEIEALSIELSDSTDSLAGAVANTPDVPDAPTDPVDPVDPVDPTP